MFDFLKRFDRQMWIAAKVMRAHIWMEMVLCDNMADMSQNGECAYVACSAQTEVSPPPLQLGWSLKALVALFVAWLSSTYMGRNLGICQKLGNHKSNHFQNFFSYLGCLQGSSKTRWICVEWSLLQGMECQSIHDTWSALVFCSCACLLSWYCGIFIPDI